MSKIVKIGTGMVSGAVIAGIPGLITAAAITTWVVAGKGIAAAVSGKKAESIQIEDSESGDDTDSIN